MRLPAHVVESLNRMAKAGRSLSTELGRPPTVQELAERTHIDPGRASRIRKSGTPITSLDAPIAEGTVFGDVLSAGGESAEALVIAHDTRRRARRLLHSLGERERAVLRLRFGISGDRECTLQEIGERIGLSRERVPQIEQEAIARRRKRRKQLGATSKAA